MLIFYGTVDPTSLELDWEAVIFKFHIWRPLTTFFYVSFGWGIGWVIGLTQIYYSVRAIEKCFDQRNADLAPLFIFNGVVTLIIASLA